MSNQTIASGKTAVISNGNATPSLMAMFPFEPKIVRRFDLEKKIRHIIDSAEQKLNESFGAKVTDVMIKTLKDLARLSDFSTHRKSIAYFVSSTVAKISYLNIDVNENIILGQDFEIKKLVRNKSIEKKYLLLKIAHGIQRLFVASNTTLTPILENRNSEYSDKNTGGKLPAKFVREIDNGLDILLDAYPYPLVLACTESTAVELSGSLKNYSRIAAFLPVDFDNEPGNPMEHVLPVFSDNWDSIREADILLRIERSSKTGNYFTGITEVYKAVTQKRGKLLIVEANYVHPAISDAEYNLQDNSIFNNGIFVKDLIEVIIERVLDNGGDVEFYEGNLPSQYRQIVLL